MSSIIVAFSTKRQLLDALPALRTAELGEIETYTPAPLERGPSPLPTVMLIAGLAGAVAGFFLEAFANVAAYPIDIGGRPQFSWPAFIPIAFENGILAAVLAGFFGFFIVNRMPRLYEPVDQCALMRRAMRDLWCVAIRTQEQGRVRELLRKYSPIRIEDVPE